MALPLLLAAGAGILGGAQYLMKKGDEREAASLLDGYDFSLPGLQGQQESAWMDNQAGSLMDRELGFLNASKAQQAQQLRDLHQQRFGQINQGMAAQQKQHYANSISRSDQLDADYNRDLKQFGGIVQPAYQQAVNALGPGMNSADSVAALYNFFNIMEPGGRVTENEDGSFTGIGGGGAKLANWFNKMRGDGLDGETRKQILDAINNQYRPQLERARKQEQFYNNRMREYGDMGLDVQSPVGSLGIDYLTDPTEGFGTQAPPVPDGYRVK